ncbi:hypothetical protein PMIN03_009098 [Paraphaeosphaeria minitans]
MFADQFDLVASKHCELAEYPLSQQHQYKLPCDKLRGGSHGSSSVNGFAPGQYLISAFAAESTPPHNYHFNFVITKLSFTPHRTHSTSVRLTSLLSRELS